uniref:RRM domain-containing protein n=1 Tax=Cannabis sativa TaxID=3483 RepID=A0A803R8U9_CANSA
MAPPMKSSKQDDSENPSNNLWVGNLASDVTDSDLMDLFAQYGALDSVTSYSSRSYAFLFFKRMEDAKAAKDALQGTLLRGNPIKIEFARPVRSDLWVLLGLFGICCYYNNVFELLNFVDFETGFIFFYMHLHNFKFSIGFAVKIQTSNSKTRRNYYGPVSNYALF